MPTVCLSPSENAHMRHEVETYLTTKNGPAIIHMHHKDRNTVTINMLLTAVFISRFGHIGRATSQQQRLIQSNSQQYLTRVLERVEEKTK